VQEIEVPVLVVGGSLVGMSTAALLAHHGVRSLVVERHPGAAIHPRAALIMQRSMEILRSIGIEGSVLRKSTEQFEPDGAIMAVETLAGKELAWYIPNINEGVRDLSPCERLFITQILLEPLLKERAQAMGVEPRFATEMVSLEEDADGVTALVRDRESQVTSTVRARYVVGADGPRSRLRDQLGVGVHGHGVLSKSVTIYFRAEVEQLLRGRNLSVIMVVNPTFQGFFRIEKPYRSGFLVVHGLGDPQAPDTDIWTGLTDERCIELVRAGLGVEDIDVEIENVMRWQAVAEVAERFADGRVFLAGDAAHTMPPYGGYGGNTGIHDAHNLSWKLAMVLGDQAGSGLLDTYDQERRPVAAFTVEQAYSRYVTRAAPFLAAQGMEPVVADVNIDLGHRYHSAAVVPEDDADEAVHGDPREAGGVPGTRAPHVTLQRDAEQISTLDLFGRSFVVLGGPEARAWCEGARQAAGEMGLELDAHAIGAADGPGDPDALFAGTYGIAPDGAVLVRPDGVVGWRARTGNEASPEAIASTLKAILCR
jgi:2-polyprenyl-6-methoxyphenol hydroxylase-like FAD-dependent oxidoreductase